MGGATFLIKSDTSDKLLLKGDEFMNDYKSPQSKSDKSASTSIKMPEPTIIPQSEPEQRSEFNSTTPVPEQKSDSRMKGKPHPAENTKEDSSTM